MIFYKPSKTNQPSLLNDLSRIFKGRSEVTLLNETCAVKARNAKAVMVHLDTRGYDVRDLREKNPNLPIIGVSAEKEGDIEEIDHALFLRTGGDRVQSIKSPRLILEHYNAVVRSYENAITKPQSMMAEQDSVISCGPLILDFTRASLHFGDKLLRKPLTVTEQKLLGAFMERPGFVRSRDQLMDIAYDDEVYVDDRTVDSHIKRLRKKLYPFLGLNRSDVGPRHAKGPIETLYGIGYRWNKENVPDAPRIAAAMGG